MALFTLFGFGLIGGLFLVTAIFGRKEARFYKKNGQKIECFVTDFEIGSVPYISQYTWESEIPKYFVTLKLPDSDDLILIETLNTKAKRYKDVKFAEIYYIADRDIVEKEQERDEKFSAGKFVFDLSGKGSLIASLIGASVFFAAAIVGFFYYLPEIYY
jgi:hypothetical protein